MRMALRTQFLRVCAAIGLLSFGTACSETDALILQPVPNQDAQVGVEVTIELLVLNAPGASPRFTVMSPTIPDLNERPTPPRFIPFGGSGAYFRWVPLGKDVGDHVFRIEASADGQTSGTNFRILIRAGNAVPSFIKPLGSGKTLDQASGDTCFVVPVQIQDPDSTRVNISLDSPIELGYDFRQDSDYSGEFNWCPTPEQTSRSDRYSVNFVADDGDGHSTYKNFNLLIRRRLGTDCPGRTPAVDHEPPEQPGGTPYIEITTRISDDIGIPIPPIVYFTFEDQFATGDRNLENLTLINMERASGTELDGVYNARIPIPSDQASLMPVTRLFYFIEVTDDDDPNGDCDHRVMVPKNGYIELPVSPPTPATPVSPCLTCDNDAPCGSGICVDLGDGQPVCLGRCDDTDTAPPPTMNGCGEVGATGCCMGQILLLCDSGRLDEVNCGSPQSCGWSASANRYDCRTTGESDPSGQSPRACGQAMSGSDGPCGMGYGCSERSFTSRSGVTSPVCVPDAGSCNADCIDDNYEENDMISQVHAPIPTDRSLTDLKLCSSDGRVDDDYFGIFLEEGFELTATVLFSHAEGDVDVSLLNNEGRLVVAGISSDDNESLSRCLEPGFYYLHVWSVNRSINNQYDLSVELSDRGCCLDDPFEEDDGPNTAHDTANGDTSNVRVVCPGNEDWYRVVLNAGQEVSVDLIFDHQENTDDLDLFFYDTDGTTNLTPCCNVDNGQSGTSDEEMRYAVNRAGTYYVVVRGYRDASNDYLIGFDIRDAPMNPPAPPPNP
jgi:hypothetical protein